LRRFDNLSCEPQVEAASVCGQAWLSDAAGPFESNLAIIKTSNWNWLQEHLERTPSDSSRIRRTDPGDKAILEEARGFNLNA
jgi:hypothetical protein